METHPYSGTRYAEQKAPQAIAPQAPTTAIHAQTQGMQAVNANIHGMESDLQDRLEYTLDQQRKLFLAETQADIDATLTASLQYPDGHPQSLWNLDGSFRDDAYKSLMQSQLARLDGLDHGYIRPESQQAAAAASTDLKSKIATSMHVKVAAALAPRAKSSTLNLAKWQASQGQYDSAIATISGAPAYALSDLEREHAVTDIIQTEVLNNAKSAAISNNPEAYLNIIGNPKLMAALPPDMQHQILGMQSHFADDGLSGSRLSSLSDKADSSAAPTKKAAQPLPLGATDSLVSLQYRWIDANGNFPKSGEAIRQAVSELNNYAARFVHPNMTETDRQLFYNIAACFNVDKEDAKAIITVYEKPFQMSKNGFDYENAIKDININYFSDIKLGANLATLTQARDKFAAALDKVAHLKGHADPKEERKFVKAEAAFKAAQAKLDIADQQQKNRQAELIGQIKSQYAEWFLMQDSNTVTDIECRMKLYDIVDSVIDSTAADTTSAASNPWDFSSSAAYRTTAQQWESVNSARDMATAARAELDAETAAYDKMRAHAAEEEALSAAHTFSSASSFPLSMANTMQLPNSASSAFIAVPQGSPMAGKKLTLHHNRRTYELECVPSAVDSPALSMRARLNLQLFNANSTFSISHDEEGRAVLSSHAVPESQKNIYNIMLSQEVRRDSKGRPIVYSLPKEDGGGSFEVAGLNEKYNKEEATVLRQMIQTGVPTPIIEGYIRSVYKQKTQYGANLIPPSSSQGLELFVRDCALNHSPKGVNTILAAAVGTYAADPALPAAVQTYISRYGEAALLRNLSKARASYYENLISADSKKEIFRKGWANRNRNITNAAYSLLK